MNARLVLRGLVFTILLGTLASGEYVADGTWLKNVPARDHEKANPFQGDSDAVAAGQLLYDNHCSHCHGKDGGGTKRRPSLKSDRIQREASDGDLFWLLTNGNMKKGMPPWSKLPDQQIWQVIRYLKSLHG